MTECVTGDFAIEGRHGGLEKVVEYVELEAILNRQDSCRKMTGAKLYI